MGLCVSKPHEASPDERNSVGARCRAEAGDKGSSKIFTSVLGPEDSTQQEDFTTSGRPLPPSASFVQQEDFGNGCGENALLQGNPETLVLELPHFVPTAEEGTSGVRTSRSAEMSSRRSPASVSFELVYLAAPSASASGGNTPVVALGPPVECARHSDNIGRAKTPSPSHRPSVAISAPQPLTL
jgi:hypothetical protein